MPTYRLRQPWIAKLDDECFDPRFLSALRAKAPAALALLVQQPHEGIYTFPLFSLHFCDALRLEAASYEHWCVHHGKKPRRPNSMNRYGVVLAELGLEDALDTLLYERLAPLTAHLFRPFGGHELDHQHSFLVEYETNGDTELGFHVDDSEVTLNACLGAEFQGAEVYFRGVRCAEHRQLPARPEEHFDLEHRAGYAALHAGAHRHGVLPLRSGHRSNLIAWFRSSKLRTQRAKSPAKCEPWCPEHPQRRAA